jgi:hypothetical protein
MDGDRPITRREDDRLGFSRVADHLARAILDLPASEGFVFGIEGKWGTGKTTLINLAKETLKAHGEPPEIIDFAPWLVGQRDELLSALFDELATAAVRIDPVDDAVEGDEAGSHLRKLRRKEDLKKALGEKLQTFGAVAGTVGKIAKVASVASVPGAEFLSALAEHSSEAAKQFVGTPSVAKRKAELVAALKQLSRRIVVFVDDLDRLEPREASEVLRLMRAVADFPNVIYVLTFDPEVLAKTLAKSIQLEDGAAYLEKIVQVSFRVPRPEAFDLRRLVQHQSTRDVRPRISWRRRDARQAKAGSSHRSPRRKVSQDRSRRGAHVECSSAVWSSRSSAYRHLRHGVASACTNWKSCTLSVGGRVRHGARSRRRRQCSIV